jgi:ribonuclease D
VIKDEVISEIAQQQPRDEVALGKLRTIPKGWERSATAASLLGAINAALAIPKDELPTLAKPAQNPEGSNAAAELLKVLLRLVAEEEGVAPKVLASSDEIDKLAADGEKADVPPYPAGDGSIRRKGAEAGAGRNFAEVRQPPDRGDRVGATPPRRCAAQM